MGSVRLSNETRDVLMELHGRWSREKGTDEAMAEVAASLCHVFDDDPASALVVALLAVFELMDEVHVLWLSSS